MRIALFAIFFVLSLMIGSTHSEALPKLLPPSPEWIVKLPAAQNAQQLIVVAGVGKSTAWISMHNKDEIGTWRQIMSTPGFIGRAGIGKAKEGDGKTPLGIYYFTKAFGIKKNPGCALPYTQVDNNHYWSGDERAGMMYNHLVDIRQYPALNIDVSEHLIDSDPEYSYCLNISYNEGGTAGLGSATFLRCFGESAPYTGGSVAIPVDKMMFVLQNVEPDCVLVIDSLENLGGNFS